MCLSMKGNRVTMGSRFYISIHFHNLKKSKGNIRNSCPEMWCSVKKVFLEISQNSQENTCARVSFITKLQAKTPVPESFLIKLQASGLQLLFKKEALARVFSCEFSSEISNNTFIISSQSLIIRSRKYCLKQSTLVVHDNYF